jgi:glycerate 2-kinase
MDSPREHLLSVYYQALAAVQGEACTHQALSEMALSGYLSTGPVAVLAIGKAAESMLSGALAMLGEQVTSGLMITKQGYAVDGSFVQGNISVITSGHPLPDAHSLLAGQRLLSFIENQPEQMTFLFLISGGASSLVEVLPEGVSLEDLQRVNNWLLSSGWDIDAMNRVRKTLSCIKGGRLAKYLKGRKAICLMISDVPGDRPDVIGSGFLFPDKNEQQDEEPDQKLSDSRLTPELPAWITRLPIAPTAPSQHDPCFNTISAKIIATLADAKTAAANAAKALGYSVVHHEQMITGDAEVVGKALAQELCSGAPAFHIWGGETTVSLPPRPGRGGRNQQLALAAAEVISGQSPYYFLAAGTDGTDGPTQDAGALVDAGTLARGRQFGLDVSQTLQRADAGNFLDASGDLICTGPTGTNVMDLMLGLKLSDRC